MQPLSTVFELSSRRKAFTGTGEKLAHFSDVVNHFTILHLKLLQFCQLLVTVRIIVISSPTKALLHTLVIGVVSVNYGEGGLN